MSLLDDHVAIVEGHLEVKGQLRFPPGGCPGPEALTDLVTVLEELNRRRPLYLRKDDEGALLVSFAEHLN